MDRGLEALLHACAVALGTVDELWRWGSSPQAARAAVEILENEPTAASGWHERLKSVVEADPRHRDQVWSGVHEALAPLALPSIRSLLDARPDEGFDPEAFVGSRADTLYLLGTTEGAETARPVITALVSAITEAARKRAARSPSGRLSPPLSLVLDELTQFCPLPNLPQLMADGGGSGVFTSVFVQNIGQLKRVYGEAGAMAIWGAATVKIVLGSGGEPNELRDVSQLIGDVEVRDQTLSRGYGTQFGRQYSTGEHVRKEPIASVSFLRELPPAEGVLLYRHVRAIRIKLRAWYQRRDAHQLKEDEAAVRKALGEAPNAV